MKQTKFILVTGGVISSLGKGITSAAIANLLKARGYKVFIQKLDPYLNIDPGTMNPNEHGEVYVTNDGAETDLDLGHYERFIDENLTQLSNITSGRIMQQILRDERAGKYNGKTVQIVPHVVNAIKDKIYLAAQKSDADFLFVEVGGTIGDIESLAMIEALRTVGMENPQNTLDLHVTLVPYLSASKEQKTKPTQHSVSRLRAYGINPSFIVCRSEQELEPGIKEKIAAMCGIKRERVIEAKNQNIYNIPLAFQEQGVDQEILDYFGMVAPKANLSNWIDYFDVKNHITKEINIALITKYAYKDAYISVYESLNFAGVQNQVKVNITHLDALDLNDDNADQILKDFDGVLVPGGFGKTAIEGKLSAIKYARSNNVPLFGICYGMQLMLVEYARNVLGWTDANSTEIDPHTKYPIVDIQADKEGLELGGTLRLGAYDAIIKPGSQLESIYQTNTVSERHRHRYEVNQKFLKDFEDAGVVFSAMSPDCRFVEGVEIPTNDFCVAVQYHPELKTRFYNAHPIFVDFVKAAAKAK